MKTKVNDRFSQNSRMLIKKVAETQSGLGKEVSENKRNVGKEWVRRIIKPERK